MISLDRYQSLFSSAEVRQAFIASALGRLPIGLTGLAILLLVQTSTASFARGGAAAACYVTGLALVAPLLGRLIDRHGPQRTLLSCAFLFPSALLLLVAASTQADLSWLAFLAAAAAGASFPPITVCMRSYFRQVLVDETLLAAAYSAESVLIEIIFIVGPLIVALFVALASPALAVCFSAGCALVGTLVFLRSPALPRWRIERRTSHSLLGPLANRDFVRLVAIVLCFATAFGFLEIGITAYAVAKTDAAFAGLLLGMMSAGSAIGGLAYGSRSWHLPLAVQFAVALTLTAAGLALLALPWQPWTFAAWSVIAGIAIAPALIIQTMLVTKSARPEHSTEAFTWATSALLAGVGIGLAAGGVLLDSLPAQAALAAGASAALLAAVAARFVLGR
jgi:predicted MFS family arabinose efflux permease